MKKLVLLILLIAVVLSCFSAEKYAVLIAPNRPIEHQGNFRELLAVWNDMVLMYKMLKLQGYTDEHIYILQGDGTDYVPPPPNPALDPYYTGDPDFPFTDYPGLHTDIQAVFNAMQTGNTQLGIPQLTEDDFLFVWTFSHGTYIDGMSGLQLYDATPEVNSYITAEEFASYINPIQCQKKVFWLAQCRSGGFSGYLNDMTSIVVTACGEFQSSNDADDRYLISTNPEVLSEPIAGLEKEIRGGYPYLHSEFDFHMSSVTNGRNSLGITSYNNIPYSNADTDSDGIISIGEALIWEDERESYPAEDPTISDDGDLRFSTSLKYPNILRHDINGTTLIRGIVAITQDICLSNAEVTIAPGAKVYLKNRSQILVEEGASLIISDNVKIYGNDYSIPPDETNPDGVVGNRVIVNGNISIGENVTFESEYGNPWDGLYINNNADITLAGISFTKCDLVKTGGILRIQDSVFSNSQVTCESASLYMDGCNVDRGVYCNQSPTVSIINDCRISGIANGITLIDCGSYQIIDSHISNSGSSGIVVYETNNPARNLISDCNIYNNTVDGIRFYHSTGNVIDCKIYGNNKGIVAYQFSDVKISRTLNTDPWMNENSSYIHDNFWQEILYTNNCGVMMDGGENRIVDNSINPAGTWDQYLIHCPNMLPSNVPYFRQNYWGYQNTNQAIVPPANRFYPSLILSDINYVDAGYILSPVWSPGMPSYITSENDELAYNTAMDLAMNINVEPAIQLFKQIISQYPYSKYAEISAKHLLALEADKEALKSYYINEPYMHYNGDMDKLADYLVAHCNIKLENYQEAIEFFESIISNPPSELDSLMAIIDLGYAYLLMEKNGYKNTPVCMFPQFKPKSLSSYEANRDNILSNLFGSSPDGNSDYTIYNLDTSVERPNLLGNYPNPFNPTTTMQFSLPKNTDVRLSIYNIKGQQVKTIVNRPMKAGLHKLQWDGKDRSNKSVSSGVYFYRLQTGDSTLTGKCLLLK